MCLHAFETGLQSSIGSYIVMTALFLFGYTTILAWACCGEQAVEYIGGPRAVKAFRFTYILLVPFGTMLHVTSVWLVADIAVSLMMLTNLIGVAALSATAISGAEPAESC
jgi:AGCS family alanine or glycine:cation symporter